MGQRKLFRIECDAVREIASSTSRLERQLQNLFERNLSELLGIRFLATEHVTGADHAGRIDTLGIDENNCPVIIEYKRSTNDAVLMQILFYLDWLLKTKSAFELLVMKTLGSETAAKIDFDGTRLLCIAGDYSKYDLHAINQVGLNIELITYRHYGNDLLLLDYVTGLRQPAKAKALGYVENADAPVSGILDQAGFAQRLARADGALVALFDTVRDRMLTLGEDVQIAELKGYHAFKRIKNFGCVSVLPGKGCVTMYLRVDPSTVELEAGFTRDMRSKGHFGTGDLEVVIRTEADVERATMYLRKAYDSA